MSATSIALTTLIENELAKVGDERVVAHIRGLLIPPEPQMRSWDYGQVGQKFECWVVLEDIASRTAIAYCVEGFGPRCPWGLLWLDREGGRSSMGMDSGWFTSFMDAFWDSFMAQGFERPSS